MTRADLADRSLTEILCMYYPRDVAEDMGPTMLLPGSHLHEQRD